MNPPRDSFELMPDAVTKDVVHALEADRPKLRYRVTWATTFMMIFKRLLPTRLFDKIAIRY